TPEPVGRTEAMIQITPNYRFVGGMVAGLIGVAVFTGARASADPVVPAPPPAPVAPGVAAPAPAPQNVIATPGAVNGHTATATPPSANPFAPPNAATAPGAGGPAAAAPMP